jgi:hypothetical protein
MCQFFKRKTTYLAKEPKPRLLDVIFQTEEPTNTNLNIKI